MSKLNLQATIDYYRDRTIEHGFNAKGMDWKDQASQALRFEVICRYIDFTNNPTVLDVGCGDGEFFAYCQKRNSKCRYRGIDLCQEMVDACGKRFGNETARNASINDMTTAFDYVIASGTYHVKATNSDDAWRQHFHASVRAMFATCKRAVVVNVMSWHVDYRYDRLYYATPKEIGDLAQELTHDFVIDHNYPLYEMTAAFLKSQST